MGFGAVCLVVEWQLRLRKCLYDVSINVLPTLGGTAPVSLAVRAGICDVFFAHKSGAENGPIFV